MKFDIEERLVKEHSKATCLRIVGYVDGQQQNFDELVSVFDSTTPKIKDRAIWAMSHCIRVNPDLMDKHTERFVHMLQPDLPGPIKRGILNILERVHLPENLWGEIYDKCFYLTEDPRQPIATRAFAITTLMRIVRELPELSMEVHPMMQDVVTHSEKGVYSRASKALSELKSIIQINSFEDF